MQRILDIIPELVGAVYNTTTSPSFVHNGTLYVVRDSMYNKSGLYALVVSHGKNLFVHSVRVEDRGYYGNTHREPCYVVRMAVVNPSRRSSCLAFHVMK